MSSLLARCVERFEEVFGLQGEGEEWRKLEVTVGRPCETKYCKNSIVTSKYNLVTFVPRSLFEQFRRTANQYFLLIAVLMILGSYTSLFFSPLTAFSTIAPLTFILAVTMAKEGTEDIKRHRSDEVVNSRPVRVVRPGGATEEVQCRHVAVGDVVVVGDREEIPADLVLLGSSEGDYAYVETSNIDGETNLKIKRPVAAQATKTARRWSAVGDVGETRVGVEYEPVSSRIHSFNGTLTFRDDGEAVPLDHAVFLLRGSTLRNTKSVMGVVVYTGRDSRLVRNSRDAPSKLSEMERVMNTMIYFVLGAMLAITVASTIAHAAFTARYEKNFWYLCYRYRGRDVPDLFSENCTAGDRYSNASMFFTFFILYNNFIPISLYVTIEIINYMQAYYIDEDRSMYDRATDTPALARTSNMNADLGMIGYVFSDKTGTLTQNVMAFKRASVGGRVFGDGDKSTPPLRLSALRQLVATEAAQARDFVAVMAVCHTVVPEHTAGGTIHYQAESPDEEALVKASADLGVEFVDRKPGRVDVRQGGQSVVTYEVVATIPFDSTRKRMSVVVKTPEGGYYLMTKGADTTIFALADASFRGTRAALEAQLDAFGSDGLRTLVLAHRKLSKRDFDAFLDAWREAETTVGADRPEKIAAVAATVERDLVVLGATAIEDKLQDGVPETIHELARAGIKLWVLTGDKMATAINIGYSSKLLTPEMYVITMPAEGASADDGYGVESQLDALEAYLATAKRATQENSRAAAALRDAAGLSAPLGASASSSAASSAASSSARAVAPSTSSTNPLMASVRGLLFDEENPRNALPKPLLPGGSGGDDDDAAMTSDHLALVIEGSTALEVILASEALSKRLFELCECCRAVIACRVSPAQKRLLVALTHRFAPTKPITLAIGDGANDVGMIQEAQIGVGISGKEGRQAVNTADFAIAQFRFLRPLLLEHGRWNYRRNSKVIVYSFYKNIVLTFVLFYFQADSAWSGQSLYEAWVYSGYNFFLGLLPFAMGFFDRDVSRATLLKYPSLYAAGLHRMDLNVTNTAFATLEAVAASLVVYFVTRGTFDTPYGVWSDDGRTLDLWAFGTAVFIALVVAMAFRACLLIDSWNFTTPALLVIQFAMLFTFIIFMSQASVTAVEYDYFGVAYQLYATPNLWLVGLFLVPGAVATIQLTIAATHLELFPSVNDIGKELDQGAGRAGGPGGDHAQTPIHAFVNRLFAPKGRRPAEPTLVSRGFLEDAHRSLTREQTVRIGIYDHFKSVFCYDETSETLGAGAGRDDETKAPTSM